MGKYRLHTEIEINAGAERVWDILTDFAAYPDWNPFIRSIHGIPEKAARLEVRIQPSGTKGMTFRPTVLVADAGRELRWLGRVLMPGILDGEHCFIIQPLADGKVLFQHQESFSGVLVPLFRGSLDRDTRRGFEAMNQALKARAEAMETANRPN